MTDVLQSLVCRETLRKQQVTVHVFGVWKRTPRHHSIKMLLKAEITYMAVERTSMYSITLYTILCTTGLPHYS